MTKFYTILSSALLSALFISCEKNVNSDEEKQQKVNEYIHAVMKDYYLWNGNVPDEPAGAEVEPSGYFYSLLDAGDAWSYITDEKEKFLEEEINYTGETFGYDLSFGRFTGSEALFAVVNYVYPGSPAALAGLKRGDFILEVDGATLVMDNYTELYASGTRQLSLGTLDGERVTAAGSVTLASVKMEQNPVLAREVLTRGTNKIGYLLYVGFVNNFEQELVDALTAFKAEGITDLVLDLRYNPGGGVDVTTLLCSALVPPAAMTAGNVLIHHLWNAPLQAYLEAAEREAPGTFAAALATRFREVEYNLALPRERVYVLTSRGSASASELLVVGLEAYMDVVQVGDSTRGKYTAMMEFSPTEKELANWLLLPVVYKFANRDGKTDFKEGLPPDYLLKETLPFKTLGTTDDPLLAKAVELITGEEVPAAEPEENRVTWLSLPSPRVTDGRLLHKPAIPAMK
ncbi:MAG: hypothetical protein LBF09_06055 [Odoribacteraceae bacterium]|jgi:C-terminal processing protease CtpA/Prc|nr:hypothetical protein [Odoribacteraceae bacterium]